MSLSSRSGLRAWIVLFALTALMLPTPDAHAGEFLQSLRTLARQVPASRAANASVLEMLSEVTAAKGTSWLHNPELQQLARATRDGDLKAFLHQEPDAAAILESHPGLVVLLQEIGRMPDRLLADAASAFPTSALDRMTTCQSHELPLLVLGKSLQGVRIAGQDADTELVLRLVDGEVTVTGRFLSYTLARNGYESANRTGEAGAEGAVQVVATTANDEVLLISSGRPLVEGRVLELPAGIHDHAGESAIDTGKREGLEETGYEAETWTDLGPITPSSPGMTAEFQSYVRATGAVKTGEGGGAVGENEDITTYVIPRDRLLAFLQAEEAAGTMISPFVYTGLERAGLLPPRRLIGGPGALAMPGERVMGIYLGSNRVGAVVMQVDTVGVDGVGVSIVLDLAERPRISEGLGDNGSIQEEPWERTMDVLRQFAAVAQEQGVTRVLAVGTASLRDAENGADFVRAVAMETGIYIDIIDGDVEGGLTFAAFARDLPAGQQLVLVDAGGRSTEVTQGESSGIQHSNSVALGGTLLQDANPIDDIPTPSQIEAIDAAIAAELAGIDSSHAPEVLRAAGGRAIGLAATKLGLGTRGDDGSVTLTRAELDGISAKMNELSHAARAELLEVPAERAVTEVSIARIMLGTLDHLGVEQIEMVNLSLRHALALDVIGAPQGAAVTVRAER